MVDEEDKLRFEKQLGEMQAATKEKVYTSTCCGDGVGSLGQAIHNLVRFLVGVTARFCEPKASKQSKEGSGYKSLSIDEPATRMPYHEPASFMGQLEKRLKQSREAKAAEWHAVAVALMFLLLLLLSPLSMLLLFAVLFAVALGRCHKVAVTVAVAGTANTGGGGGGAPIAYGSSQRGGHSGGSGVVIVRYAGGRVGTGGTVSSAGGYTYHTFTSSGNFVTG